MNFVKTQNINEVVFELGKIVKSSMTAKSNALHFAFIYYEISKAIQKGIHLGIFEDNERMSWFTANFGNRYLEAYYSYQKGLPISQCWQYAFDCVEQKHLSVVQHLLLGINAHINLDLVFATLDLYQISDPKTLEKDFFKIDELLTQVYCSLLPRLAKFSLGIKILNALPAAISHPFLKFHVLRIRKRAWKKVNKINPSTMYLEEIKHATDLYYYLWAKRKTQAFKLFLPIKNTSNFLFFNHKRPELNLLLEETKL